MSETPETPVEDTGRPDRRDRGEVAWPTDPPSGKRPNSVIDEYRRSADLMRDTIKWIVSIVPGAGIVVTLAAVVPSLAEVSPVDRDEPIWWLVGAACWVAVLVATSALVFAARLPGWKWVVENYGADGAAGARQAKRNFRSELDGEGFLRLYGYEHAEQFFGVIATLDPAHVETATGPGGTLLDFAAARRIRGRFVAFLVVGTFASVAAVLCVSVAQIRIGEADARPTPIAISSPAPVSLSPTEAGRIRLTEEAACRDLGPDSAPVEAWMVNGTLQQGTAIIDDPRCEPTRLTWATSSDGVAVPR